MSKEKVRGHRPTGGDETGIAGILKGLGSLVEKLGDLADTGGKLSRSGEVHGASAAKDLKGVYGFTVKVGLGGGGLKVEPFGNIGRDEESGRSVVQEVMEPAVDVFEEEDHVLVVAEMPGIGAEDVRLEVQDDILTITAEHGKKKFRKEVLLPGSFRREQMHVSCANGVFEVRCVK